MPEPEFSDLSVAVIIVAAGSSRRLQGDVPKQWRLLGGRPLISWSFRFFDAHPRITRLVVALDAATLEQPERLQHLQSAHAKPVQLTAGGVHRQETVWRALQTLPPDTDIVLVHDAARPFPPREGVDACIETARAHGGAILARPVVETIKRINAAGEIVDTIDRANLWGAQTPQGFLFAPLMEAYRAGLEQLERFTDDAGIFESHGGVVRVVMGSDRNFKVTTPEDFHRAEQILAWNPEGVQCE
jgi:2-C-methyl-D-erythritol 4-phosphate cytidylyltransferase